MNRSENKSMYLTPGTRRFINALEEKNAPPLYTLTPPEAREVLIEAQSEAVERPDADIKNIELPVGPTGSVDIRIIRPKGTSGPLPIILYLHGGGWVMGNKETHDRLVRELAVRSGAAVVFPEYAAAPEFKYPVQLEQAYAILEELVKDADTYQIDPEKIIVAGDSAGGNMAIALAMIALDRKGPVIRFQLLFYPVTDATFDTPSYQQYEEGPWLTKKAMEWFWDAYLPDEDVRSKITVSPLRSTMENLRVLPPALIITAENDVLRDEGEMFAAKLGDAGVEVACVRFNGTIHDFMMLDGIKDTAPAHAALCLAGATVRQVCSGSMKG